MVVVILSEQVGRRWRSERGHQLDPCLATVTLKLEKGLASIPPKLDKLTQRCVDKGFLRYRIVGHSRF